ncbi:hypothetical protein F53441_7927 [Fusarium austroafricanum]|uniref:Uncharacterized protein n=1 Tax=Fusarium austroafricanum TaxID=2364996 RepID=A0A8H4KGG4_9HYPO|nr:hypothetical protein F53441_7927 [Fusarium austroafricanum]
MLPYLVLPLALWAEQSVAFGGEDFQLNTGLNMVSLSDAAVKDVLLPDSVANFTEWIGGNSELESFGLRPRQRQCVNIHVQTVLDVVLKAALVYPADAAEATPDSAVQANAMTHLHKSAAVAAGEEKRSVALLVATTQILQSAVEVSAEIVPRAMTACLVVDAVHQVKSAVEIVSAITHGHQLAALALELFGRVLRACCENGSCLKGTTCCDKECCRSNAYCGNDGFCKICPAATRKITSTDTVTTTKMKTVRVTTDIEPDTGNAPEFTCVPMTATNDAGGTLELDKGCTLHYEPPEATTSDDSGARLRRDAATAPANPNRGLGLFARQASCTPYTTYTRTVWETETSTETGTKTVTVQGEDATFSCPEMEVINGVGDTLALDAECVLSFSPAEPTSASEGEATARGTGEETRSTAAAGGGSDNGNGGSGERASVLMTFCFVGVTMFLLA